MDEPRLRQRSRDPRHRPHVARRLVAPAPLPLLLGVELVEAADRAARGQRPDPLRTGPQLALVEAEVTPARVLGYRADQPAPRVLVVGPADHLGDEVGLGRDRQLGVGVEHHPQQRRPGAVDADDERRREALRLPDPAAEPRRHRDRMAPVGLSPGDHVSASPRGSVPGPSPVA